MVSACYFDTFCLVEIPDEDDEILLGQVKHFKELVLEEAEAMVLRSYCWKLCYHQLEAPEHYVAVERQEGAYQELGGPEVESFEAREDHLELMQAMNFVGLHVCGLMRSAIAASLLLLGFWQLIWLQCVCILTISRSIVNLTQELVKIIDACLPHLNFFINIRRTVWMSLLAVWGSLAHLRSWRFISEISQLDNRLWLLLLWLNCISSPLVIKSFKPLLM